MIQDLPFRKGKVNRSSLNRIYSHSTACKHFFKIIYSKFGTTDEKCPLEIQDLLYRCLNPNPALRPSIHEFALFPWISDAPDSPNESLTQELNHLMSLENNPEYKWEYIQETTL